MERDDLILDHSYSVAANHDEEHGRVLRKTIWKVTAILSAITIVEVLLGMYIKQDNSLWPVVKISFLIMTLVKAAYIVLVFMHLGDEKKSFKWMLFGPYFIFMGYLVFQALTEANHQHDMLHGDAKVEVVEKTTEHAEH